MDTPAQLATPTDLTKVAPVIKALNTLISDSFVLYVKYKNFHWHVCGPHFRDYHLMFDEQADAVFSTIDKLAERVRKLGGLTVGSLHEICRLCTLSENTENYVAPQSMISELCGDNQKVAKAMRDAHAKCESAGDCATASDLEIMIDETERRVWFLFEASQSA